MVRCDREIPPASGFASPGSDHGSSGNNQTTEAIGAERRKGGLARLQANRDRSQGKIRAATAVGINGRLARQRPGWLAWRSGSRYRRSGIIPAERARLG